MNTEIAIKPLINEMPSGYADRVGQFYAQKVSKQHKKENGQFFTHPEIAHFMAGLTEKTKEYVRILDPGAGAAILSISLIEALIKRNSSLKRIDLDVYEIDPDIIPFTQATLAYVSTWLNKYKIKFTVTLNTKDFVLENKDCFQETVNLFSDPQNSIYDIIISNPPYFKIPKEDKRAIAAKSIVWGQPNIYSIFMMVAAKLLKTDGELIFITPRSFTSGNYFRVFRESFFREISIEHIHLFGSRTDTFDRDSVLQETLILKGRKQKSTGQKTSILVTHSRGISDIGNSTQKIYQSDELIDLNSKEKIIHLPVNETDDKVIQLFRSWEGSFGKYEIRNTNFYRSGCIF